MSQIKKFVDRVASAEGKQSREIIMPLTEAKLLRDEILIMLLDKKESKKDEEVITVVVNGGKW
jgi:hypothetical protein